MTAHVPSLENTLYLTDPLSIIAYTMRKFFRTPKDAVPILPEAIVSFPWLIAKNADNPDHLCNEMQSAIQNTLTTIFSGDRTVSTTVTHVQETLDPAQYSVNISIIYTNTSGELSSTGLTIPIKDGRPVIPEDNLYKIFTNL